MNTLFSNYSTTAQMNTALVSASLATQTQLATKQDILTTYSENIAPNTYYVNTDEPNGTFLSGWTGGSTNNTGYQTVSTGVYVGLLNLPTAGALTFSFQLRGVGSKTDLVLTISNGASWIGAQEIKFTGLNSTFKFLHGQLMHTVQANLIFIRFRTHLVR